MAMSVYVIRAFVKMRGELAANAAILKRLAEIDKTLLIHDVALREIFEKLRPLLAPPPSPPKPEIGFHVKEDAVPYTAPISEQRPKVATNGRGSGFCRALPGENMTISLTNPFLGRTPSPPLEERAGERRRFGAFCSQSTPEHSNAGTPLPGPLPAGGEREMPRWAWWW
jgi:hypothetical protein